MQEILEFPAHPALDRSSLLTSPANQHAVEWVDRWPDWPGAVLALHGPEGCGKTHLVRIWQRRAGALFLTPQELTEAAIAGFAAGPGAVVVDDYDQTARASEPFLLHLYNLAIESGQFLLLAGRRPAARCCFALPDLASRLGSVPAIEIGQPDDALLSRLLRKLFADRQLAVPDDTIAYLLARMERSFAAAERIAGQIDKHSLIHKRPVTLALARSVLEEQYAADVP